MGEVVGLRGRTVSDPRKPDQSVIACAEDILARAKSGELVGLHGVLNYWDDGIGTTSSGVITYSAIGALDALKSKLIKRYDED